MATWRIKGVNLLNPSNYYSRFFSIDTFGLRVFADHTNPPC